MLNDLIDFDLPPERIALRPARPRDSARLLAVRGSEISDHQVLDLPDLLQPGDVLVFNDTKVIPAQLEGRRGEASIGATLHKREGPREWQAFLRNAKRARVGDTIDFGSGVAASVVDKQDDGSALLHFHGQERGFHLIGEARSCIGKLDPASDLADFASQLQPAAESDSFHPKRHARSRFRRELNTAFVVHGSLIQKR